LAKYPGTGGRAESRTIDLGSVHNDLVKLEALGGRFGPVNNRNEYAGSGDFVFPDHSEMRFYIQFSDYAYQWPTPWIPVKPGIDFPASFTGRYVRIAVEFFPSADGETTPYLEEVRLVYRNIDTPPPPGYITALARDGAVDLSWRGIPHNSLGGYLVYYGTSGGVYSQWLDAGNKTSVRIEGLRNGTLYFFSIASYDSRFREPGDFSRETAARPQREYGTP